MTDIALDERAKFAAQLRNAANEMRAEDHNGWPVLCDIVADYLDVSPSQVAPANPAQVTDAMVEAGRKAVASFNPCMGDDGDPCDTECHCRQVARAALTAAIGAGGQAVDQGLRDAAKAMGAEVARSVPVVGSQPHPADERVVEALRKEVVEARERWEHFQKLASDHKDELVVEIKATSARADALAQEVERLRGAWQALDSAISSSIKENDQPHRVFRDGKLVMEGEAAEIYHAHLMLLRRMARAALGDRP